MKKFYFTYGTSTIFPYQNGWTEVYAENMAQATAFFRVRHPDKSYGTINCASLYTEEQFERYGFRKKGNFDGFCHEVIGCFEPSSVKIKRCCFCGAELLSFSEQNNAAPLKDAVCCSTCNATIVVPYRIYLMTLFATD